MSEIKLSGAAGVSRRLDSDTDFAKTVLDGIASGDSVWLDVAAQLKPPSAAAEASLAMALASALPRAPRKVLPLIGDNYTADQVCGMPLLKADSGEVIAYYGEAVTALGGVKDTSLTKTILICRTALDSSRSRRLQRIDPAYIIKKKPGGG